jgi:hypothetical protein
MKHTFQFAKLEVDVLNLQITMISILSQQLRYETLLFQCLNATYLFAGTTRVVC